MAERIAILSLLLAAGCGGASGAATSPPADATRTYVAALRGGDSRAAYALLDDEARSRLTFERFAALHRDNRDEVGAEAIRVDAAAQRGVPARARVRLASGEEVVLVMEDGEWRLEGGVLGAPALRTPQDAVAALRQALLRRSLPGLSRVLSRQARAEIETEIASLVEGTADPLDLRIEIQGNVALVRLAGGGEIVLVREAGEWHVSEIR